MIKKLRGRLVGVSMLSLLIVLLTIVSTASLLNYRQLVAEADEILDFLAENGGSFPDISPEDGAIPPESTGESSGDAGTVPESGGVVPEGDRNPPEAAGRDAGARTGDARGFKGDSSNPRRNGRYRKDFLSGLSIETPFETRYFSVTYKEGKDPEVETGRIAAVNQTEALNYAEQVLQKGKQRGFAGDYRYLSTASDGSTMILFLDRGRNLSTFFRFLMTSYGASLGGLLVVFALISFFSGRIIRPFVENYEKQRRFITDAGHELKTPLAIIEADTDVLEMDLGEDNEWLQDIKRQTQRLADLTRNLISLARMEEGGNHFTMIDFPVSEVVAEAADSYRGPALSQGKTFTLKVEPMLTLHGDESAVRQLTGILLDNALKYSGEQGSITLSLSRQGKNLHLLVSNTAEHISRESTRHLFERFYRADSSRNSGSGGYGIGLSIAQAIVSAHKGKITASTEDEQSLDILAVFPGCTAGEDAEV